MHQHLWVLQLSTINKGGEGAPESQGLALRHFFFVSPIRQIVCLMLLLRFSQVVARQAPVAAQAARQDGPPAPAQGRAALALPCHHQRAGAARHHPAGARRAAGQLGGRLRGVATVSYTHLTLPTIVSV